MKRVIVKKLNLTITKSMMVFFVMLGLLTVQNSKGQTVVSIGGGASVSCPAVPTATYTTPPAGITFGQWVRGSGITCASASDGLSGSNFNNATASANQSANKFYSITVSADATHTFTLNAVTWATTVSGSAGTPSFAILYSNNGGTVTQFGSTGSNQTSNSFTGSVSVAASTSVVIYFVPVSVAATSGTVRLKNASSITVTAATLTPTISPSTNTFTAFTTTYGTVSTAKTVSVTGANLTANITATAATGFEVSNGGAYGASTTFVQSGGSASGTLSVRLKANATVTGSYNGITAVSLTSTGAATRNYATAATGNSVSAKALTITGVTANNKIYDGNTTATLSGTPAYSGLQNGEVFSVSGTASANFNNASVGNAKPVTVTGYTTPSSNYTVTQPTGLTANITGAGQANADFRSKQNGNFSASAIWEYDQGGGSYINATQAPGSSNNVSITHDVTLDQDFTVGAAKNFVLGTGAVFTVDNTRTFTIAGNADFAGKPVTFISNLTGNGSLGQVTGILNGATNVTIERFIPNNGFRSWRLLSVPVTTTQTIRQAWQEGDANPLPKDNNLANRGTQITGVFNTQAAAAAAGFDSTSVQASMLRWNGVNWSNITSTNQPVNNFNSYFLYIRGERGQTVTGAVTSSSATTLRTKGTIFTGDKTTNVGAGSFELIPNLYPSAINFSGLTRTGGVNNLFYIWDSKKLNGNSLGVYQTFSNTNSFNCMVSGGSYVLGQPNTTIESGQSFFVTSGAAGTVVLKESAKVSGSNGSLGFRPSVVKSKIDTRLYNSSEEMLDANTVVFESAYSKAVSDEDAPKLGNPGANFAIETGSKLLAIEGTAPVEDKDIIQFRMWNLMQGTYKLEFAITNLNTDGLTAMLVDSYKNTTTAINVNGITNVKFTIDQNATSSSANRFRIVFSKVKEAIADTKQSFTIAPNPVENGVLNLQFKNQSAGKYYVTLVNSNGQSILKRIINYTGGNAETLNLPSGLAAGFYKMNIESPEKKKATLTLFINVK